MVGFRTVWGQLSQSNNSINVGIDNLPIRYQSPEDIYWEWSAGVGNIFKILAIEFNFRGNYLDNPGIRKNWCHWKFEFFFLEANESFLSSIKIKKQRGFNKLKKSIKSL